MTEFYDKIDAFISLSSHEGMPQSILEAAATKLPIVCTDAGGMAEFVDSEWVVPISPEHETVRQMNDKLEFLRTNADVRVQVAERNLQKVLSEWAWNIRVRDYDEMFNGAC
jgi:glycosyltransferase involved in cell wall biosynthesis